MDVSHLFSKAQKFDTQDVIRSSSQPLKKITPQQKADHPRLKELAKDYESSFLQVMLGQMFSGLDTRGAFKGGFGEEAARGFMVEEMGKSLAKNGGIGLSEHIYREMVAMQEARLS